MLRRLVIVSALGPAICVFYADDKHKAALAATAAHTHSSVSTILFGAWFCLFALCLVVLVVVTMVLPDGKDDGKSSSAGGGWATVRR